MHHTWLYYALVVVPAAAGGLAFALRSDRLRRGLLVATAAAHAGLTAAAAVSRPPAALGGWIGLDTAGLLFLALTSLLFLAVACYAVAYLGGQQRQAHRDDEERFMFDNAPEAVFTGCLLVFLATMTLVEVSLHFGLIWVAVEATTLASAPLIYFHRHHRSLEAVWKYLMICSVGIALALLGLFALAAGAGAHAVFGYDELLARAPTLPATWLKAAFVLMLVGYGTKMGIAPLHTWLPDAHSEAPALVSALLSGSLLNCAFLALWRMARVCGAAGLADFTGGLFVFFGLLSIGLAAVFIMRQRDMKRMLAYSSVENMGLILLGAGLGGVGAAGAWLQAVNHALVKCALFLLSGNLLLVYGSRLVETVRGARSRAPATAALWVVGVLALAGMPPFGAFFGKWLIFQAALRQGRPALAALFLGLVLAVFAGMAGVVLRMVLDDPAAEPAPPARLAPGLVWPPLVLLALSLGVGLYLPGFLEDWVRHAAGWMGGW